MLKDEKEAPGNCYAPVDRDRLMNDAINTGVTSALISGFALGNLSGAYDFTSNDVVVYMASCVSVHMCTCACLCSALIYRKVNMLKDEHIVAWAKHHNMFLRMPMAKFAMGCVAYLVSVIVKASRDLAEVPLYNYITLGIGVMGIMTMVFTYWYLVVRKEKWKVSPAAPIRPPRRNPGKASD